VIAFSGRAILLDIEGTTSSVSYVYDVMFPYARRGLAQYLADHWGTAATAGVREQIAQDAGHESFAAWLRCCESTDDGPALVREEIERLMDGDVKATGLKQLQGQIWKSGFENGQLKAHVYNDVPPALTAWQAAGVDVRIYSSGSVQAQKMFFTHSEHGDLLSHFSGHYDTTTGPKREAESYRQIAAAFDLPVGDILFLSDVVAELKAADEAGLQTGLCLRPGNAPVDDGHGFAELTSFADIKLSAAAN